MAGSRKDVNYVADDSSTFAISVDESNIELVMGGSVPLATATSRKPSNLKNLRSVVLSDITGNITRRIPVLTQARYNQLVGTLSFTLPANDVDEGTNVVVSEKIPEKYVRIPKIFDTGKNDGDAS
jgi:hypothetical protein